MISNKCRLRLGLVVCVWILMTSAGKQFVSSNNLGCHCRTLLLMLGFYHKLWTYIKRSTCFIHKTTKQYSIYRDRQRSKMKAFHWIEITGRRDHSYLVSKAKENWQSMLHARFLNQVFFGIAWLSHSSIVDVRIESLLLQEDNGGGNMKWNEKLTEHLLVGFEQEEAISWSVCGARSQNVVVAKWE